MDDSEVRLLMGSFGSNQTVELRQTHISWVILAGRFAYKIKKPVKFSFLDFTTLDKRKRLCEEEVLLNQRLSPDIYLGVVAITKTIPTKKPESSNPESATIKTENTKPETIELGGKGIIIDYAVKMKRLDENRMMDRLLDRGEVSEKHVEELARIVADFHGRIEAVKEGYNSPEMVGKQIADLGAFRETIEKAAGLGRNVDFVLERSAAFIRANDELMRERAAGGWVRDCHGDLHSGNIFIQDGRIIIIDCIEFSRDFRCVDVASEIAFMAMDLDAHGREDLSGLFVETYLSKTHDSQLETLLPIYKCYRANVRAKIAAIDFGGSGSSEAAERIKKYMTLAEKYATML